MEYIEASLTITESQQLEYIQNDGRERTIAIDLRPDPLRVLTIKRLEHWVKESMGFGRRGQKPTQCAPDDLKLIGCHLYEILFQDKRVREPFEEALLRVATERSSFPDRRLRLSVVFDRSDDLARLPWEFLFFAPKRDLDAGWFLAGQRTELLLNRRIADAKLVRVSDRLPKEGALKVLLVLCNPDVIAGERFDPVGEGEVAQLKMMFTGLSSADSTGAKSIVVEDLTNPTYAEFRDAITAFAPHIVHYVGHGKPGSIALRTDDRDPEYDEVVGGIQFCWVSSTDVRELFAEVRPRLVFLNACNTALSDSTESFRGLARELIRADIGGVVAMQYAIVNNDATRFATRFYQALSAGLTIDEAVRLGRAELGAERPSWQHPRFAIPVAYVHDSSPVVTLARTAGGDASPGGGQGGDAQRLPRSGLKIPGPTGPMVA